MVQVKGTLPPVGIKLPSVTNKFETSWAWQYLFKTEVLASFPNRQPPACKFEDGSAEISQVIFIPPIFSNSFIAFSSKNFETFISC